MGGALFNPYKKVSTTLYLTREERIIALFNPYKKVSTTLDTLNEN